MITNEIKLSLCFNFISVFISICVFNSICKFNYICVFNSICVFNYICVFYSLSGTISKKRGGWSSSCKHAPITGAAWGFARCCRLKNQCWETLRRCHQQQNEIERVEGIFMFSSQPLLTIKHLSFGYDNYWFQIALKVILIATYQSVWSYGFQPCQDNIEIIMIGWFIIHIKFCYQKSMPWIWMFPWNCKLRTLP